jgi:putative ATPase
MPADLFSAEANLRAGAPLAERLRPVTLDEVVGQRHLLGEGKPLYLAFAARQPHSMIFWGPPGVGKTTLARLMARGFDCEFLALSAVFSGVKEIREAVRQAEDNQARGRRTLLFVDEAHRFNKAVKHFINQRLRRVIVHIFGLPHCSEGVKHG